MRRIVILAVCGVIVAALLVLWPRLHRPHKPNHDNVVATVFWVGEPSGPDNAFIPNQASAWDEHWQDHYGGVDDPNRRQANGKWPAGFVPQENSFYIALPYNEFTDKGAVKKNATQIPWYDSQQPPTPQYSILKNHWVRVSYGARVAYGQWEDVGPMKEDDGAYVFGTAPPAYKPSGIDLSPAIAQHLGMSGRGKVSWSFVDAQQVPQGPWTEIITTRQVAR